MAFRTKSEKREKTIKEISKVLKKLFFQSELNQRLINFTCIMGNSRTEKRKSSFENN
jgi:hypothetical protein